MVVIWLFLSFVLFWIFLVFGIFFDNLFLSWGLVASTFCLVTLCFYVSSLCVYSWVFILSPSISFPSKYSGPLTFICVEQKVTALQSSAAILSITILSIRNGRYLMIGINVIYCLFVMFAASLRIFYIVTCNMIKLQVARTVSPITFLLRVKIYYSPFLFYSYLSHLLLFFLVKKVSC